MNAQMKSENAFDVEKIRQDFPILSQQVNEKPLIYFDNAATTQKPKSVIDKMTNYYMNDNANVHRGVHALSERATHDFEVARGKVQKFIHAKSADECVFVRGATEAINLVANSFVKPRIRPGEKILLTELEHHSNIVPWQLVCKSIGCVLRVVPFNDNGELDLDAFQKLLTPDTKFLALNHISNSLGTINPIKEMIAMAHEHNVRVLVDGAQGALHSEVDVQDLDCDFYVFSGHKMYGPTGIGVLYGKEELLNLMVPYQGGGEMVVHVSFESTEYQKPPHKFEAGTPNIAGAIGLGEAIDYLGRIGLPNIIKYEKSLLEYATKLMQEIKHIHFIGTAKEKASLISFILGKVHPHDIGTILNSMGIAIRTGHLCAMPVMDHFGLESVARASLCFYNTREEIDVFVDALTQVEGVFD